jgi:hypothetical protein
MSGHPTPAPFLGADEAGHAGTGRHRHGPRDH